MRYLSLFSGVECASLAWQHLGWECVAHAEIKEFCNAVLAERFPGVPNLGDVSKITRNQIKKLGRIDLVVFGSPCQDLSIAGRQTGLEGERSGLFKDAMRIIEWCKKLSGTRFALWENVPGSFSSNKGADFSEVLRKFTGAEYDKPAQGWQNAGIAYGPKGLTEWRVLDAKYFGVPQRRRRIFAFTDFGDWASRPQVLFESESVPRNTQQSRAQREDHTGESTGSIRAPSHWDGDYPHPCLSQVSNTGSPGFSNQELFSQRGANLMPGCAYFTKQSFGEYSESGTASTVLARNKKDAGDLITVIHGTQDPIISDNAHTIMSGNLGQENVFCFHENERNELNLSDNAPTLSAGGGKPGQGYTALLENALVRKGTPLENERLMGMPDNHTNVEFNGRPAKDTHRYEAIGNGIAIPPLRWIGERIDQIIIKNKLHKTSI